LAQSVAISGLAFVAAVIAMIHILDAAIIGYHQAPSSPTNDRYTVRITRTVPASVWY
jgi:hypothetical protein